MLNRENINRTSINSMRQLDAVVDKTWSEDKETMEHNGSDGKTVPM